MLSTYPLTSASIGVHSRAMPAHYGKPRTKTTFPIYVERFELDLLNSAARALGLTRGAYCRAACLRAARADLGDSAQHVPILPPAQVRAEHPQTVAATEARTLRDRIRSETAPAAPPPAPEPPPPPLTPEERAERRRRLTAPRRPDVILAADGRRESDGLDEPTGEPI